MRNKSITVIGLLSAPFIQCDIKLLRKYSTVYTVNDVVGVLAKTRIARTFQYLHLGLNILLNACPKIIISDSVFIWFADVHAVIPIILSKLLGKKCVVAIGGYEVCNMPDINYGMMRETVGIRKEICKWVIRNADVCIVPSQSYYDKTLPYVNNKDKLYIAPDCVGIRSPITRRFYNKKNIVLMVAQADKQNYLLKGIPYYNRVAGEVGDASFYLIGRYDKEIEEMYNNICYLGLLSHEEVLFWMEMSKVYCQLSVTESFGVALLESTAMGCIPVVNGIDNLPLLIDTNGIVINTNFPETTKIGIELALSDSSFEKHETISKNAVNKCKILCKMREHALKELFKL